MRKKEIREPIETMRGKSVLLVFTCMIGMLEVWNLGYGYETAVKIIGLLVLLSGLLGWESYRVSEAKK